MSHTTPTRDAIDVSADGAPVVGVGAVAVPSVVEALRPFVEAGVFGAAEVHLAARVAALAGCADHHVLLAVAAATWAARVGHSCADLDSLPAVVAASLAVSRSRVEGDTGDETGIVISPDVTWPDAAGWAAQLSRPEVGDVVRVVDAWDAAPHLDRRPLVLHGRRAYLQRHWVDECTVAASLRARAVPVSAALTARAQQVLDALLPAVVEGEPNLQRTAADMVLGHRLSVVVGGPGTGKTYSVARLLAAILEQGAGGRPLHVGLAAPTGKAAARLKESIRAALEHDDVRAHVSEGVRTAIAGVTPTTIHRLLGPLGAVRQRFRHDSANPLPHDVIVIDETSMVDVPLLARLCDAVRAEARLVLIGDPDQLESVDLGAALADIQRAGHGAAATGPLVGSVERLRRGHRFGKDSPIALLADAVRDGDADIAAARLEGAVDEPPSSVRFIETDDPTRREVVAQVEAVIAPLLSTVRAAALAGDAAAALAASVEARILCAHRHGRHGVSTWNRLGESWLAAGTVLEGEWYAGRPLLMTRNDVRLGLSNGDTGVVVATADGPRAVFAAAQGTVSLDPVHLDDVETAFAMTVHKSQGSEYPQVVLVLPPVHSPLVGRELLYTGITRTRHHLLIVGTESVVRAATLSPASRMTGLADALRA
ncbi:MAG: exodeoxyribonuclease V subunit alpha [Ilumatobacteraceae bacterium]